MPGAVAQIVSWNLTQVCNLACGHCYLDAVTRRREAPDELSTEVALEAVRQVSDTAPGAMLVLTGGEPLLRRDLAQLVARASALGLVPVIGTNGVLLDERRARALKAAGAAGVGISVDSASAAFHDRLRGVPGAWGRALAGARAARATGLAVQLQATLFAENRGELEPLAALAESVGAMALNFFFLVCTGRGVTQTDLAPAAYEETLRAIARLQAERPGMIVRARCAPYSRRLLGLHAGESAGAYAGFSSACLAGRRYFRVTPQGRVTPCPYIPEPAGDLRSTPLREIWEAGRAFVRLREELPGGKCGRCDFRVSCGGCRARALAQHGDLMAEDAKCAYVPPADARPEVAGAAPSPRTAVAWDPEAEALLARIPLFVRARVRERLEEAARREAVAPITVEFMRAHRPPMPFAAPRGVLQG